MENQKVTDEQQTNRPPEETEVNEAAEMADNTPSADNTSQQSNGADNPPPADLPEESFEERLERLGGEPAPVITPEEFARLQRAGQVHIDARGQVRTARRNDAEAGVSLRKRRAWYGRSGD
jgi:hypothetical protein